MTRQHPICLAGRPSQTTVSIDVINRCDGAAAGRTPPAGKHELETASAGLESRREETGRTLAEGAGKPSKDAKPCT